MGVESESNPFPARNATSELIRNFFTQLLLTKMVSIDEAKASEIANRWPDEATGIQFWIFSLQTFCDIFGKAYGMLLWSHVHNVTENDTKVFLQAMNTPSAIERSKCCRFVFMYPAVCRISSPRVHAYSLLTLANNRYLRVLVSTYGTFHRLDRNVPVFPLLLCCLVMRHLRGICVLAMVLPWSSIAKRTCRDEGCTQGDEAMNVLLARTITHTASYGSNVQRHKQRTDGSSDCFLSLLQTTKIGS